MRGVTTEVSDVPSKQFVKLMVKFTKVGHISMFNIFIKCKVAFETDAFSAFFLA